MLEQLMDNFWFEDLREKFLEGDMEEKKFLEYLQQFQQGNFQNKDQFVEFFLNSSEDEVFILGMRLFMAIASHEDFELLEDFLSECEEDELRVFLAYVEESLSLQVIPYLLSLYEEWEDTSVGDDIARCICGMLGQNYIDGETYDLEQLGEFFVDFAKGNNLDKFYYDGEEFFSGNLSKLVIRVAINCKNNKIQFYTDQAPSILSNSFGIKCPVFYDVEIDDKKISELYDFVNTLSTVDQKKGEKYFYRHKVV